jgi:hypothetical protein
MFFLKPKAKNRKGSIVNYGNFAIPSCTRRRGMKFKLFW